MKTTFRILSAAALLAATLPTLAATSVKATVNGMVCAFCAQGIEKRISKMEATKAVFVDLKNKTVAIEAKEGKSLDQKAITAEIADAGYDVVKMEPTQQSVQEIKAQLKGKK
jgi:copper chaperone CopZ